MTNDHYCKNDFVAATVVFPNALSDTECAQICALSETLPPANVAVYPPTESVTRSATTKVLEKSDELDWLNSRIHKFVQQANEYFEFELSSCLKPVMCVSYGVGDFFHWHTDLGDGDESARKISVCIQLSPSQSYEGGLLQMICCEDPMNATEIGTLIAFPAHLAHRVTPVTRGQRMALVTWAHGPPFK